MNASRKRCAVHALRGSRVAKIAITLVTLALLQSMMAFGAANALPNQYKFRPSLWTPTDFVTVLDQDAPWGNAAYFWKWSGPRSTGSSIYDGGAHGVLELGWKDTGHEGCDGREGSLNRTGFPPDVNIQNDHTEDSGDAVIWMADLHLLRADTIANPGKEYSVSWRCNQNVGSQFRGDTSRPYLETQVGHWDNIESPNFTFSDAALHYIPAEQGHRGVPATNSLLGVQTNSYVPWTNNWNFENPDTSMWITSNATKSWHNYAGGAETGAAYLYLQPNSPTEGWLSQNFKVKNQSVRTGEAWQQYQLGSRTDYQFEGTFRCPTWSPAYYGKNTPYCMVSVWIKTAAAYYGGTGFNWNVPNDGNWYYILSEDWSAQTSDDDIEIWINNNGYPLDVDVAWVSSGL